LNYDSVPPPDPIHNLLVLTHKIKTIEFVFGDNPKPKDNDLSLQKSPIKTEIKDTPNKVPQYSRPPTRKISKLNFFS